MMYYILGLTIGIAIIALCYFGIIFLVFYRDHELYVKKTFEHSIKKN